MQAEASTLRPYLMRALRAGHMDPDFAETFKAAFFGIALIPFIIPWPYSRRNYIRARGDR